MRQPAGLSACKISKNKVSALCSAAPMPVRSVEPCPCSQFEFVSFGVQPTRLTEQPVKVRSQARRPTIEMLGAGFNIYVVEDCCGATSSLLARFLLACSSLLAAAGKIPAGFTERYADANGVKLHRRRNFWAG